MIILDTNVVSEPMKLNGNPAVQTWLDQQAAETLYLTTTSLSELLVGIEMLPDGKRAEPRWRVARLVCSGQFAQCGTR